MSKHPKPGQTSVFQSLASRYPELPVVHSVGRLDLMSEGLLLFTNAGEVSRCLEHPYSAFERQYHVELLREYRALPTLLATLDKPTTVDGIEYKSVSTSYMGNKWVHVKLSEGFDLVSCSSRVVCRQEQGDPLSLLQAGSGDHSAQARGLRTFHAGRAAAQPAGATGDSGRGVRKNAGLSGLGRKKKKTMNSDSPITYFYLYNPTLVTMGARFTYFL